MIETWPACGHSRENPVTIEDAEGVSHYCSTCFTEEQVLTMRASAKEGKCKPS